MEVTIKEILDSLESIKEINNTDMSINAALKVSNVVKKVEEVIKLYNDKRVKLFVEYGEDTEEGEKQIAKENIAKFTEEFNKLIEENIQLDIEKIQVSILGDIVIKPSAISNLSWLLEI